MKNLMSLSLVVAMALIANPAFAQCSSCAGNSPVFSQGQSYAPISYGNQMSYSTPGYYPSYGAPAMAYSQPVYGQPSYSQPIYSQPVYAQSGCSSCYGNSFVSTPVYQNSYSQPMMNMNQGCNSCGSGSVVYGSDMGMMGTVNTYSDPYMGAGTVIEGGGVMVPGTVDQNSFIFGGSVVTPTEVVTPPTVNTDNSIPPVPVPAADAATPEASGATPAADQPTPDTGDDT